MGGTVTVSGRDTKDVLLALSDTVTPTGKFCNGCASTLARMEKETGFARVTTVRGKPTSI